jgi:hypothetical protein
VDVERSDQRYHPLLILRIVRTPLCVSRAARGSKTYYSGMGPPQRSRLCIVRYPQSQKVCAVVVERSDRRYHPILVLRTFRRHRCYPPSMLHRIAYTDMGVQAVKVPRPGARKKDTVAPKYSWCRMIICVLGQYLVHKKVWSLCTFWRHRCYPPSMLHRIRYTYTSYRRAGGQSPCNYRVIVITE